MRSTSAVLLILAAATAGAQTGPVLTFEKSRVVASGVTPGGKVVWYAIALESRRWSSRPVTFAAILADSDNDGVVAVDLEDPVPGTSVWAAVDLTTGEFVLEVPPNGPRRPIGDGLFVLQPGQTQVRFLKDVAPMRRLHMLFVRPAEGAWTLFSRDGGNHDKDGKIDREQDVKIREFEALTGEEDAPSSLKHGDVLIGIESRHMAYFGVRVGKDP